MASLPCPHWASAHPVPTTHNQRMHHREQCQQHEHGTQVIADRPGCN